MKDISRRTWMGMGAALAPAIAAAQAEDLRPTVSKVYPGSDGKLIYAADEQGNTIQDFSYAGYRGGGVAIPTVPVKETIWPVVGDNTANIQAAIDKVSALPLDKNGFRGAVLLRAGYYKMATAARIQASGVVLRGESMSDTGTILVGAGKPQRGGNTLIILGAATPAAAPAAPGQGRPGGAPSAVVPKEDAKQAVTDDYVPVGARTFKVANAKAFKPGDSVIVRRIGNQEWVAAMGMSAPENKFPWRPFNIDWDRVVMAVNGNSITIDAPISCAIEKKWGGGEVMPYTDTRIENVAVENLRGVSEYDPTVRTKEYGNMDRPNYAPEEYYSDENHFATFVSFAGAKNGWARNLTALHFVNSLAQCARGSKWITVQDCVSREPISQRRGARRFTYLMEGQLALVLRCQSDKGRHSFVTGNPPSTNNVFLDCVATNPYSSSEPHANWSTGHLWDNVHAPLTARYWKDINIGWAGGNAVFWNCEGQFLVQKPPTAQNYSFGHVGVDAVVFNIGFQDPTKEGGYIESLDTHVFPRSLYLTQLRERLGEQAVRNVAKGKQLE